jgi:hypothetical protein
VIPLVEYSFDRDDFDDRDPRGLFDRDEMRRERDLRDEIARERALMERDRMDDEMRRAESEAAKLEKTKVEDLSTRAIVEAINNPLVSVASDGKISSRSRRRSMRRPSGRDIIRQSGQFTMQGFDLPVKKPRKKNKKHCKNLSTCLRQANAELRTKSGKLRKGKTQADIMRRAQRLLRKMK